MGEVGIWKGNRARASSEVVGAVLFDWARLECLTGVLTGAVRVFDWARLEWLMYLSHGCKGFRL